MSQPSERFIALTRNPTLPPPAKVEPSAKKPGDFILTSRGLEKVLA
jgi:hypothetical protein